MASSMLATTSNSNCTSSAGLRNCRRHSAKLSGAVAGGVVGEQHGVELLLFGLRYQLLLRQ